MAKITSEALRELLAKFLKAIFEGIADLVDWLVKAVLVLGVIAGGIWIFQNWKGIATPVVETYNEVTLNCEKLEAQIQADNQCLRIESCTMTRDELAESQERLEKSFRYCSSE